MVNSTTGALESWGGTYGDSHSASTMNARIKTLTEHIHGESKCYPTLGAGIALATHADPWTLGTITEIVPASTITSDYDIHFLSIESLDDNGVYELHLFHGAGDTAAGCVRFTKNANQDATTNIPLVTVLVPANDRLRAQLASSVGNSNATVAVSYHEY